MTVLISFGVLIASMTGAHFTAKADIAANHQATVENHEDIVELKVNFSAFSGKMDRLIMLNTRMAEKLGIDPSGVVR